MLQRGKIIAIVSALLVLGVVFAVLAQGHSGGKDGYRTVCDNMITAITKKDYTAGHNLLSSNARRKDSLQSWKDKTSVLGNIYEHAQITFNSATNIDQGTDKSKQPKMQLTYTITHPSATSDVICIATKEGKAYVVDGFSSKMREASTQ